MKTLLLFTALGVLALLEITHTLPPIAEAAAVGVACILLVQVVRR